MKKYVIITDDDSYQIIVGDEQSIRYAHVCGRCADSVRVGDRVVLHQSSADFDYCVICGNYTHTVTIITVLRTTPWTCTREPKDPEKSNNGGDYWHWVAEGIVLGATGADEYAENITRLQFVI
ncbi:MAG: hypothetical protein QXW98_07690 [Candidatus Caldarchaeum sp.]